MLLNLLTSSSFGMVLSLLIVGNTVRGRSQTNILSNLFLIAQVTSDNEIVQFSVAFNISSRRTVLGVIIGLR